MGGELTRWAAWKADHPGTLAAVDPPGARRSFVPERVLTFMLWRFTTRIHAPSLTRLDNRLDAHEEVVGVTLGGEAKAYPLALLRAQKALDDRLAGVPIRLEYDPRADRARARREDLKQAIPISRQWWLGWSEFHPGTAVYSAQEGV